ncbi:MAG: signal recognition particle subunit SRP19/SEC65 family protein [Thermoplasmata archaeon]
MPDHFFVYPAYLARDSSRALGRRVPSGIAVREVTLEEIVAVAKALGFSASAEPEKQYPRQFFTYAGRVRVVKRKGTSKAAFLRRLAEELTRRSQGRSG